MADHLALMQDGQILQVGTPKDCYQNPVSAAAARLLGPVNVLDVVVTERGADSLFGTLPANKIAHGAALLLLRPEAISFGHSGLAARVSRTQFAGANTVVTLEIHQSHGQDIVLQGQISSNLAPNIGETVAVEVDLTQARLVAA